VECLQKARLRPKARSFVGRARTSWVFMTLTSGAELVGNKEESTVPQHPHVSTVACGTVPHGASGRPMPYGASGRPMPYGIRRSQLWLPQCVQLDSRLGYCQLLWHCLFLCPCYKRKETNFKWITTVTVTIRCPVLTTYSHHRSMHHVQAFPS
jgi:hypothetical protein